MIPGSHFYLSLDIPLLKCYHTFAYKGVMYEKMDSVGGISTREFRVRS